MARFVYDRPINERPVADHAVISYLRAFHESRVGREPNMFAGGNLFGEVEPLKGIHFKDRMTVAAGKNHHGRNHAVLADIDRGLQFVARKNGTLDRGLFPDANGATISLKEELGIHQDVNLGADSQGIVRALVIDQGADKTTGRPDTKVIPVAAKVSCLLIGVNINPAILKVSTFAKND